MPNLKIFAAIVMCVFVLVVGLEWLPKQYVPQQNVIAIEQTLSKTTSEEKAMSRRDVIGYSIVGYFLFLSALLYLKIALQRSKPTE